MGKWFKVFFLFFILGSLLYVNSLNHPFLMDDYLFLNNPMMSSAKYMGSQWNPYRAQAQGITDTQDDPGYYRPLAHIVLSFCYATFKEHYVLYHLFNLFLFVFVSFLIHVFVVRLTGNFYLGFLTGLFYLIHPINGIVVNYISASVFAFQVIFMLGSILLLLSSLGKQNDRGAYLLSLLLCFLSLFWHESGVMTPFYIAAFVFIFRPETFSKKCAYLFPYFLIVLVYFVFRYFFVRFNSSMFTPMASFHMTALEHTATFFRLVMWYLLKLIYPQGIVMQQTMPVLHQYICWDNLGMVLLAAAFLLLMVHFRRQPICLMAMVWMLIGFAPLEMAAFRAANVGPIIEPHWFVFSSIGFFIVTAYVLINIYDRRFRFFLIGVVIAAWCLAAHAYNQLWADQKTYAHYWAERDPGFKLPYFFLGEAYQYDGDFKRAIPYYRQALMGDSTDVKIYNNLGVMEAEHGQLGKAEADFKASLKYDPFSGRIYNNLGHLYFKEGRFGEAKEYYSKALSLDPLLTTAEFSLLDIDIQEKDIDQARRSAVHLLSEENDPMVLTRLGTMMARNGLIGLAWESYSKALRLDSNCKDTYLEMGVLLANLGKYDQAIHLWTLGQGIDPNDPRFKDYMHKALILKSK